MESLKFNNSAINGGDSSTVRIPFKQTITFVTTGVKRDFQYYLNAYGFLL